MNVMRKNADEGMFMSEGRRRRRRRRDSQGQTASECQGNKMGMHSGRQRMNRRRGRGGGEDEGEEEEEEEERRAGEEGSDVEEDTPAPPERKTDGSTNSQNATNECMNTMRGETRG